MVLLYIVLVQSFRINMIVDSSLSSLANSADDLMKSFCFDSLPENRVLQFIQIAS